MNTKTNIHGQVPGHTPEIITHEDQVSFKQIILKFEVWKKHLVSRWGLIVLFGVAGGLLGGLSVWFKKPVYTSELSFVLEEEKGSGGLGGALGIASQFGFDLGGSGGGGAFAGDNLPELMRSRTMVEKTLLTPATFNGKIQTLVENYISYNGLRDDWKDPALKSVRFLPAADRSHFTRLQDSLLGSIYKDLVKNNLSVAKKDKKLNIITVTVNSVNESFSKIFTEVLVKNVSDFYIATRTKKSSQNVQILQHQTDSVRRVLNAAISGVAVSSDANPNPNPAFQVLRVPSQRRQVDVQANTAILTELVKNLEISKVSLRKETPLIQVIDTPVLPLSVSRASIIKSVLGSVILAVALICIWLIVRKEIRDITLS